MLQLKDLSQQMYGDQSKIKNDTVYISEYSFSHHEHGKAIVSHELGHAISHYFSKNQDSSKDYKAYLKLRKCANSQYQESAEASPYFAAPHKGDRLVRLLNEAFHKGRSLPQSCIKALEPSKNKLKKCL